MTSRSPPADDSLFRAAELVCRRKILFLKCQMPSAKTERSYLFLSKLVSREQDLLRRIRMAQAAPAGGSPAN